MPHGRAVIRLFKGICTAHVQVADLLGGADSVSSWACPKPIQRMRNQLDHDSLYMNTQLSHLLIPASSRIHKS